MILLHKSDLSAPTIRLIYRSKSSLRASSPGRSGGGKGKGRSRRRACNYVSGIWIPASKKSMRKCEILIGGDDISNDVITLARDFQCLFTFAIFSASRWLAEIWQLSGQGATRELEVEFKFRRRSCKRLLPFPAPPPERPEELARRLKQIATTQIILPEYCSFPISAYMTVNRSNVRFVIGCASP